MNSVATAKKKGVGEYPPAHLDPELLISVYECCYLTVQHLKRLFPQTYAAPTDTTPRRHLRSLEQLGYIKSHQRAKDTPKIFSPKPTKIHRFLRHHYPETTFHETREEVLKDDYLNHELAVTDIQIDFILAATAHPNLTLLDQQRRYFHHPNRLTYRDRKGKRRRLVPDLGKLLNITSPTTTFPLLHFIEMDLGNESPAVITRKLAAYPQWFEQTGEEYLLDLYRTHHSSDPRPAFRILIVTRARRNNSDDLNRVNQLYHTAQQLPRPLRKQTFFTTNQAIRTVRSRHGILTAPIWYAVRSTRGKPQALFT